MAGASEGERAFVTNRQLMDEIQRYPAIYDKFSEAFRNKFTKLNAWKSIAETLKMNAEDAERRYTSIRSAFGRYLKKLKSVKSGSGRSAVPTNKEMEGYMWLATHISHRATTCNLETVEDSESDSTVAFSENDVNTSDQDLADNSDGNHVRTAGADFDLVSGDEAFSLAETFCPDQDNGANEEPPQANDQSFSAIYITPNNKPKRKFIAEKSPLETCTEAGSSSISKKLKSSGKGQATSTVRSWSAFEKHNDLDHALLQTCKNINKSSSQAEPKPASVPIEPEDEETLFCKSLIPQLKRLPSREKAFAMVHIKTLLTNYEFPSSTSTPKESDQPEQAVQQVVPVDISSYLLAGMYNGSLL